MSKRYNHKVISDWLLGELNSEGEIIDYQEKYIRSNIRRVYEDSLFIAERVDTGLNVLDMGANPPMLAALLKKAGFRHITVTDPNIHQYKRYFDKNGMDAHAVELIHGDAQLPSGMDFDLVCFCEVIEHLTGDLLSILNRVGGYVKPGGFLYLTTPNMRSVYSLYHLLFCNSSAGCKAGEGIVKQYTRKESEYGYYGHVKEYTTREVTELLRAVGFDLLETRMMPDYRRLPRRHLPIKMLEHLLPAFRTFAKYLFVKAK